MNNSKLHGIYLVIDPSMKSVQLIKKVKQALRGGVDILQIWNHWPKGITRNEKEKLITSIHKLAADFSVPVFINDDWKLLKSTPLQGIHFDTVPDDFEQIKQEIERPFTAGITCSNDLETVRWAAQNDLDYISFCAMYPSPSVDSCEIVRPKTVHRARKITDLPLFLSGGMTPNKIKELNEMEFNGVAVISGILNANDVQTAAEYYTKALA